MKNFTHLKDHSKDELEELIDKAIRIKNGAISAKVLAGKSVALCFMDPSLRTQSSFATAIAQLGGYPIILTPGKTSWVLESEDGVIMEGAAPEHAKDAVKVLSRFAAAIGLRSFPKGESLLDDQKEAMLTSFIKAATVPVINLESASGHPVQALADLMTIKERMEPKGKKFLLAWAPHIKALPSAVPASAAEIAAAAHMDVTILRPKGFDLPRQAMAAIKARGASITVTDDIASAYKGAHVVYAKSWGQLANYGAPPPQDAAFRKTWIVDDKKMAMTDDALFMHCLPVRRNLVVSDSVIDGPASVVFDQAENRLHTAKALLLRLFSANHPVSAAKEPSYA